MTLVWTRDGGDWPNRAASRFVRAGGIDWHVQVAGKGPALLLLHGTGAATHSWGDLLPLLAADHRVIAPDLPGHGFTAPRPSGIASLAWMGEATAALLAALDARPAVVVGHSAGAALALRMALDDRVRPDAVVAINGALLPFPGLMRHVAPVLARLLFLNPFAPRVMAWRARNEPGAVERLVAGTGSRLRPDQAALYARLFGDAGHCDAALSMMANWDLDGLRRDLPRLAVPVTLLAAARDGFVPPARADEAARLIRHATVVPLPDLGHLAHEEDAGAVAAAIRRAGAAAT